MDNYEPQTPGSQIYRGECEQCDKSMKRTLPANAGYIKDKGTIRVFCAACHHINELPQTGADA